METPAMVRTWRQELLDGGLGASTVSKAYRLPRGVLNTAGDDELIRRNPCRIRGAGVEHPGERPVLTLSEVIKLADSIDGRYRMLVLLAVFASLRWGELMGLRKTDFDLTLRPGQHRAVGLLVGARTDHKAPKTEAGGRTSRSDVAGARAVEQHFADYSELRRTGGYSSGRRVSRRRVRTFSRSGPGRSRRQGLTGIDVH